jgi:hypothetical protein
LSILEVCMSMVIDVQFLTSTQEKIPAWWILYLKS